MKFNVKQMLIAVSENGYLINELVQLGYSSEGTYYYELAKQEHVNGKFVNVLRKLFTRNKEHEPFIENYCDAAKRIPVLSGTKVCILVAGGIVQEVYSSEPMDCQVYDTDNEGTDNFEDWNNQVKGMHQIL